MGEQDEPERQDAGKTEEPAGWKQRKAGQRSQPRTEPITLAGEERFILAREEPVTTPGSRGPLAAPRTVQQQKEDIAGKR